MSLPTIEDLRVDDEDVTRVLDRVRRAVNPVLQNKLLDGVLIQGVGLVGGGAANDVSHKLGHIPSGYLITRQLAMTPAPYAVCKTAAAQSFASGATNVVNFDTVEVDAGASVTTGAGWQFKCPLAGTYRVSALVTVSVGGAAPTNLAQLKQLNLRKNGSPVRVLARDRKDYYEIDSFGGTALIDCAAGDLLDVTFMQVNPGASAFALYNDATYNHIEIQRECSTDSVWDTEADLTAAQQAMFLRLRSTLSKTVDLWVF